MLVFKKKGIVLHTTRADTTVMACLVGVITHLGMEIHEQKCPIPR